MTLFEFVTVAVSIVLSFGIVRLLDGLRPAFDAGRRYWAHAIWLVITLNGHVMTWWTLWSLARDVEWNYGRFLWLLVGPGILYLMSTALVTDEPRAVPSWRDHYFEIRRWFFGTAALFSLNVHLTSYLLYGRPLLDTGSVLGVIILAGALLGFWSSNPRLHGAIAVVLLALNFLGMGALVFSPTFGS